MARLAGKVALITGGESGIGLATARLFVSEGARVHLVALDGDKLDAAAADLGEEHALATVADVTDEPAVVRAIAAGAGRYGRFDVLFSNAGISGAVAPIGEYPPDVFARTLAVHVLGAFHRRERVDDLAHVHHRRRPERLTAPLRPAAQNI